MLATALWGRSLYSSLPPHPSALINWISLLLGPRASSDLDAHLPDSSDLEAMNTAFFTILQRHQPSHHLTGGRRVSGEQRLDQLCGSRKDRLSLEIPEDWAGLGRAPLPSLE